MQNSHLWRCIIGGLFIIFCSGICFGFVALKPVLIEDGVFSNLCPNSTNDDPCNKRILQINLIFQAVSAGVNAFSIPIGILVDKYDAKILMFFFSIIWSIFCSLAGISLGFRIFDEYFWWLPILCLLIVALVGAGFFLIVIKFMFRLEQNTADKVNAYLTACWDLSAVVFFLFAIIYNYTSIPLWVIFVAYSAIMLIPLLWYTFTMESDSVVNENIMHTPLNSEVSKSDIKGSILTIEFAGACLFMIFSMLFQAFYISTFREQTIWLNGGQDGHIIDTHNLVFSIMLPVFGFGSNFLFSKFMRPTWRALLILSVSILICGVLSTIQYLPIQFVTYTIFVPWRIFSFIILYSFLAENFGKDSFATLATISLSISGFVTFASYGLDAIVEHLMNGSFMIINLIICVLASAFTLFAAYLSFKSKKRQYVEL